MSSDDGNSAPPSRPRRGSITTQTLSGIFGRPTAPTAGTPAFPTPISTATAQEHGRRRLSVTGVGLSATSPTAAFSSFNRRSSVSTAGSESIDESAIEDGDGPGIPSSSQTSFGRRMSFGAQALRTVRTGSINGRGPSSSFSTAPLPTIAAAGSSTRASAGGGTSTTTAGRARAGSTAGPAAAASVVGRRSPAQAQASKYPAPRTTSDTCGSARSADGDQGFNWSEQFRSRAESTVSNAAAAKKGTSPSSQTLSHHQRATSVSEMPTPPTAALPKAVAPPAPAPVAPKKKPIERPKPDAIGERILRGQFMMD